MEKMLVTKALKELTLLDSKINKLIQSDKFITFAKTVDKNINTSVSKAQFESQAKSTYQSVEDLIKRRASIKAGLIHSNAITEITICGQNMTVAGAIDLKNIISLRKDMLSRMKEQFAAAKTKKDFANKDMEKHIQSIAMTAFGVKNVADIPKDEYAKMAEPYRFNNQVSLIDPLNIEEKIKKEEKFIEEFTSKIDLVLSISNCKTEIEI